MQGVHVFPFNGTPQDLQTTASPTFAGLTLSGNLDLDGNQLIINSIGDVFFDEQGAGSVDHTYGGTEAYRANASGFFPLVASFSLGGGGNQFSDLFLETGGVINLGNGDVTLTHGTNLAAVQGGNLLVGGTTLATSAADTIHLFNGTAPTASVANGVVVYSEDVSASAEFRVRDEAGNVTTLSSHNTDLFTPDPNEPYPFSFRAHNDYLGEEINVDMAGAIRALEELTGKQFIYRRQYEIRDWGADKKNEATAAREAAVQRKMAEDIEVGMDEALEDYEIKIPSKTEFEERGGFMLDPKTGQVRKARKSKLVRTGKFEKRVKSGYALHQDTGKITRKKTRAEAEAEVAVVEAKEMPAWMASRVSAKQQKPGSRA